jgi:hypothetical protein
MQVIRRRDDNRVDVTKLEKVFDVGNGVGHSESIG